MTYIQGGGGPSGTIGADGVIHPNLDPVTALGVGGAIVGAVSYLWSSVQVPDSDTSGYVPAGIFDDPTDINAIFTPDGPLQVTLILDATSSGGITRRFTRIEMFRPAAPVAALVAVSNQNDLAPIAFDASGSTGTGLAYVWSIRTQPAGSTAAIGNGTPNDDQHKSIVPDAAGMWQIRITVIDDWNRTSNTERGFRTGDSSGWITFNPLLGSIITFDPGGVEALGPVVAADGYYTYTITTASGLATTANGKSRWVTISGALDNQMRIEWEFDMTAASGDNVVCWAFVGDGTSPPASGRGGGIQGDGVGGNYSRSDYTAGGAPSWLSSTVCTEMSLSGHSSTWPVDQIAGTYEVIADGARVTQGAWGADTSIIATGDAYLGLGIGSTAAVTGITFQARLRYRVLAR